MQNFFKKLVVSVANPSPPVDTTQVLVALARVVRPEEWRDASVIHPTDQGGSYV